MIESYVLGLYLDTSHVFSRPQLGVSLQGCKFLELCELRCLKFRDRTGQKAHSPNVLSSLKVRCFIWSRYRKSLSLRCKFRIITVFFLSTRENLVVLPNMVSQISILPRFDAGGAF